MPNASSTASRPDVPMSRDILKTAARLSNPWGDGGLGGIRGVDAEDLARVLLENHVSFVGLEQKLGEEIHRTPLGVHVAHEKAELERLRREYERIRVALDQKGIRCLLLKATGLPPSFPHLSHNLDVLVEETKGDEARQELHALGYVELLNVEEPAKFLFRRFAGDGGRFTFHLHELVGWGVPFVEADAVWQNALRAPDDDSLWIPGPVEALLITTAHWFYEDKRLSLQNLFLTADALRKLPCSIGAVADRAGRRGWEDGFCGALKIFDESWRRLFGSRGIEPRRFSLAESRLRESRSASLLVKMVSYGKDKPARIPFIGNKVVYYKKVFADRLRSKGQRFWDFVRTGLWAVRWKLHIRSQRPLLVAVSGCDGSGKTLQVERLRSVLDVCDLRVKTVWARGASSDRMALLIRFAKMFAASGSSEATEPATDEAGKMVERRKFLRSRRNRVLFAWAYAIDMALVYAVKVRLLLLGGYIVICDRYVEDAQVDFALVSGVPVDRLPLPIRALRWICPRAPVAFVLDVDESEALRRKPEEGSTEHIARARTMFKTLADKRGAEIVDSCLGEHVVHELIAKRCLQRFYGRYRTLVNALLASNPNQLNTGRWRA